MEWRRGDGKSRNSKSETKDAKRLNSAKRNKKHDNDSSNNNNNKREKQDEILNAFPNFVALTEEEKLAFFEALSAARKNVEKNGVVTKEKFGTIHDEYLKYFDASDRAEGELKNEKNRKSQVEICNDSDDAYENITALKNEEKTENDGNISDEEETAKEASSTSICENVKISTFPSPKSVTTLFNKITSNEVTGSEITIEELLKDKSNEFSRFSLEKQNSRGTVQSDDSTATIVIDSSSILSKPDSSINEFESILTEDRDKIVDLYMNKKKRNEQECWLNGKVDEDELFKDLLSSNSQSAEQEPDCVMTEQPSESIKFRNKENIQPKEIMGDVEKVQSERSNSSDLRNISKFEALNLEEREIFFNILKEAHDSILEKNPEKKNDILSLEAIFKRYQNLNHNREETTAVYRTTTEEKTVQNDEFTKAEDQNRKLNEKKIKNLKVKVKVVSADNERLEREKLRQQVHKEAKKKRTILPEEDTSKKTDKEPEVIANDDNKSNITDGGSGNRPEIKKSDDSGELKTARSSNESTESEKIKEPLKNEKKVLKPIIKENDVRVEQHLKKTKEEEKNVQETNKEENDKKVRVLKENEKEEEIKSSKILKDKTETNEDEEHKKFKKLFIEKNQKEEKALKERKEREDKILKEQKEKEEKILKEREERKKKEKEMKARKEKEVKEEKKGRDKKEKEKNDKKIIKRGEKLKTNDRTKNKESTKTNVRERPKKIKSTENEKMKSVDDVLFQVDTIEKSKGTQRDLHIQEETLKKKNLSETKAKTSKKKNSQSNSSVEEPKAVSISKGSQQKPPTGTLVELSINLKEAINEVERVEKVNIPSEKKEEIEVKSCCVEEKKIERCEIEATSFKNEEEDKFFENQRDGEQRTKSEVLNEAKFDESGRKEKSNVIATNEIEEEEIMATEIVEEDVEKLIEEQSINKLGKSESFESTVKESKKSELEKEKCVELTLTDNREETLKILKSETTQTLELEKDVTQDGPVNHSEKIIRKEKFNVLEVETKKIEEEKEEKHTPEFHNCFSELKKKKVVLVDDEVIEKIKNLIEDLDKKAKSEECEFENEYLVLLLSYIEYLSKVLETLIEQRNKAKRTWAHTSITAAQVHLKFEDEDQKDSKPTEQTQNLPSSISDEKLYEPEQIKPESKPFGKKKEIKKSKLEENLIKSSELALFSDSDSSGTIDSTELEELTAPMSVKRRRLPKTKIRLLQDLLQDRAEFVEGSISEFKIVHKDIDFEMVEQPRVVIALKEDEEEQLEKSNKYKFFKALARICQCGKTEGSEGDDIVENLKGEAVPVDVSDGKTRNAASATLNESTMEVLKAAQRKKVIQKYWKEAEKK